LEAEGIVSIKFRGPALVVAMHRVDHTLQALDQELKLGKRSAADIKAEIKAREVKLAPYYHTVAVAFADLHDTPGRMKAKEVIREMVPWKTSRTYFYWRMRRRLIETKMIKDIQAAGNMDCWQTAKCTFESWADAKVLKDDQLLTMWAEKNAGKLSKKVADVKVAATVSEITSSFAGLDTNTQQQLIAALQKLK